MSWYKTSLKNRIYLSMMFLVFASMVVIGATTVFYFQKQNSQYHFERIQRKEKTINSSLQYFLNNLTPEEVNEFISKEFDYKVKEISDVNSLSIFVYNIKGEVLINTDLEKQYSEKNIDPFLLFKLKKSEKDRIVEENKSGKINTYSYVKNHAGQKMVIINIPYDPSKYDSKTEVWSFLEKLIEIFILLFLGGGIIAFLLSRYITKSIEKVRKKLENVEINERNEKLEWDNNDEIGVLVNAYNNMIEKLEISSEKLAKNERQFAWREMAKQVAHEIKNPLTPMKLSIQHLHRSLDYNTTSEKEKVNEFKEKMIQQIDLLTEIANEFSSFAELPKTKLEKISLSEIIKNTVTLFQGQYEINLKINSNLNDDYLIEGDENQLIRILTNLVQNSIQAIGKNGNIIISLNKEKDIIVLTIDDDGVGVPEEIKGQIFEPKFTTKSTGKGLGLAIVEQIINNHHGNISLIDKNAPGACFKIIFPKSQDE